MTIGQVSDLFVLALTPWLIKRFSLQSLFVTGMTAWGVRYILLAAGSLYAITWPSVVSILMNGPCFVFIYVIGVMYVDRLLGGAHRGAAQGTFALVSAGFGELTGAGAGGDGPITFFFAPGGFRPPPKLAGLCGR